MKNIFWKGNGNSAKTVSLILAWPEINTRNLAAGTPINASGVVANDDTAIGLLATDCSYSPDALPQAIVVSGLVDLAAIEANTGLTISDAAKSAMDNILFIGADGKPSKPAGGGGFPADVPFTFSVGTSDYIVPHIGMTWREFINSEYNPTDDEAPGKVFGWGAFEEPYAGYILSWDEDTGIIYSNVCLTSAGYSAQVLVELDQPILPCNYTTVD